MPKKKKNSNSNNRKKYGNKNQRDKQHYPMNVQGGLGDEFVKWWHSYKRKHNKGDYQNDTWKTDTNVRLAFYAHLYKKEYYEALADIFDSADTDNLDPKTFDDYGLSS